MRVRYENYGGSLMPDPEGHWVHIRDVDVFDVSLMADVLTEYHIRMVGGCSESHRADAQWLIERYVARDSEKASA